MGLSGCVTADQDSCYCLILIFFYVGVVGVVSVWCVVQVSEGVTNGILHFPTTVLYARRVVKYVVCTTFRRAGRCQTFSPHSSYFRIPLCNLALFDSICFPSLI